MPPNNATAWCSLHKFIHKPNFALANIYIDAGLMNQQQAFEEKPVLDTETDSSHRCKAS